MKLLLINLLCYVTGDYKVGFCPTSCLKFIYLECRWSYSKVTFHYSLMWHFQDYLLYFMKIL